METLKKGGLDHRDRMARRSREQTESVADIGLMPDVVDSLRKEACRYNLLLYLTSYFPNSTGLKPFSEDHERIIERIQLCILDGGRFVNAVYRGFAKTTISELAALWAISYGHRKFVVLFGGDQSSADGNIDSIKRELDSNDLLLEDFPEICYPIRCLEGKPQRQHSQTYQGELTHIRWTADTIVMPQVPGSLASNAILSACGLTSASRGMKYKRTDGTQQRPDFVIVDDPQTDESAASALQCRKRLGIIRKSILKSAGHNKALAIVINATVIEPDDLVDQLLDPKRNAAWQGERVKMVKSWSKAHDTFWLKDYADVRTTYDKDNPQAQRAAHDDATELYRQRRAEADEGCVVSWRHCYDEDSEISAIQHAYNALIDDGPEVFASEYQNEPLPPTGASLTISAVDIVRKVSSHARGQVPQAATKITAFIDVQKTVLWYAVCAWESNFTGYVLDYGTYPDQRRERFTLRDARHTLEQKYPGTGLEGWLFAGLKDLCDMLIGTSYVREDDARLTIERLLIDANWGDSTETVYKFCSRRHQAIMPSHGQFTRASSAGFNAAKPKQGERRGLNWRVPPLANGKPVVHCLFDANSWKSFLNKRLTTAIGDPGSLSLFKAPPAAHSLLADHLTAETPALVLSNGRASEEWTIRPHRPDNHWLDCLVGCAVGASMQGVALNVHRATVNRQAKKKRRGGVSYIES